MSFLDPTGFDFLTNLMSSVGNFATEGISKRRPVGSKAMNQTFGALENAPSTVLPGGGVLNEGRSATSAREELPAATLPLFQADRGNKLALSGTLAGASELGSENQQLSTQYRSALSTQLDDL